MPHKAYGKDYERKLAAKKYKRILTKPPKPKPAHRYRAIPEPEVVFSSKTKAVLVPAVIIAMFLCGLQLTEKPAGMYFGSELPPASQYALYGFIIILALLLVFLVLTGRKPRKKK